MKQTHLVFLALGLSTLCTHPIAAQIEPIGNSIQVGTNDGTNQFLPTVAAAPNGNFVVAWSRAFDFPFMGQMIPVRQLQARAFDSAGAPVGFEFNIRSGYQTAFIPDATAIDGGFVVAWEKQFDYGVHAIKLDASGSAPTGAEFLVDSTVVYNNPPGEPGDTLNPEQPVVAATANGGFVVVWSRVYLEWPPTGIREGRGVHGRLYDSNGTPGSKFQVNTTQPMEHAAAGRDVASDPSGNFVAVWDFENDDAIFGQRFNSNGTPVGTEFSVSGPPDTRTDPSTCMHSDSSFVVEWTATDGSGNPRIQAQRFDSGGTSQGTDFRVSLPSATSAQYGEIVCTGDGGFTIAWDEPSGFFGRRYDAAGDPVGTRVSLHASGQSLDSRPRLAAQTFPNLLMVHDSSAITAQRMRASGEGFPVDSFKCYKAIDREAPPFQSLSVTLADQFAINDGTFKVVKPRLLCNPVAVDSEGINRPDEHQVCYKIRGPRIDRDERPLISVSSDFGVSQLEIVRPLYLCIPSLKTVLP